MNIDLLSIVEKNKELEIVEENIDVKKELRKLLIAIIEDKKAFTTHNKKLLDVLNLPYKTQKYTNYGYYITSRYDEEYKVELNKKNIKKIQNYLDEEEI